MLMNINQFLDELQNDHQHGLRELNKMLQAGRELQAQGFSQATYEVLSAAANFINCDIRTHNQKEEDVLFPALEAQIGPGGPTTVMRSEHQQLWSALDKLETILRALPQDHGNSRLISNAAELSSFIHGLLTQHIYKEDNILYPMAREILTSWHVEEINRQSAIQPVPFPPSV